MENTKNWDWVGFDDEGASNRLSFSDFTIYNQNQEPNSSFLDPDQEHHHYKAEIFTFSTTNIGSTTTNTNIIFCRKIINTNEYCADERRSAALHSKPAPPKLKSSNSKKYNNKVLIGLAKVPTRMELSDIKKRQSRLAPAPLFRGVVEEHAAAAMKLKCRSYLGSALAKTCFC